MAQPFFASMTLVSASLCLWAGSMLARPPVAEDEMPLAGSGADRKR